MKYIFSISILFLSIVLLSCSEAIPSPEDNTLVINNELFEFDSLGGKQVLIVASNAAWEISCNSAWCEPSIKKDSGDVTLLIEAEPNDLFEVRTATFSIKAKNVNAIEIIVNQTGILGSIISEELTYPDMRDLSSLSLSKLMGVGWNIGNSMEALYSSNDGKLTGDESSWGNPRITKQLIDSVKAAGFKAVRIPVAWSHQLEEENSYTIRESWLNRVEEVVNYALENEMYVFINVHWDGGWMNHPDNAHKEGIKSKLELLWIQIAEHFIDYNDFLLFAGSNEVHVENNWNAPSVENREVQNSFNQIFVDAVRSTGGRNKLRHLIVQGYNTNIDNTIKYFELPEDLTEDRILVEVHFYDPYDFTLQEDGGKTLWGKQFSSSEVSTWGQESSVSESFKKMKNNFVDKGIPVVLGEYGVIYRADLLSGLEEHTEARNYYLEYVTKAALENGMVPFYWDNGYTGNNGLGLFNRNNGKQIYPDAIQSIMKAKN